MISGINEVQKKKQGILEMNKEIKDEDQDKYKIEPPTSAYGFDYNYHTDTDDETKYETKENKKFSIMSKLKKEARVM
jgi:hypothetical protein